MVRGDAPPAATVAAEPSTAGVARLLLFEPVGLLDYRVPEALAGKLERGVAVKVPLGKRHTEAYVAALYDGPGPAGVALKEIDALSPDRPALPGALIDLVVFAADYYRVSPGELLQAALPAAVRPAAVYYRLTPAGELATAASDLSDGAHALLAFGQKHRKGFSLAAAEKSLGLTRRRAQSALKGLVGRGLFALRKKSSAPRQVTLVERTTKDAAELGPRAKSLGKLLQRLEPGRPVKVGDLVGEVPNLYRKLELLEQRGLIRKVREAERLAPHEFPEASPVPPLLTDDQKVAVEAITAAIGRGRYQAFVLHGVTGSGKTEVYLRVIERALALGKTALILVPEIALTPQLGARFRARFGDRVATFHSGLTPGERRDEWERVARGEAVIGLGARSALFLPLANIGVVVVDEEHETSFKQEESPRYHARDLAVVRAHHQGAVVVLGSATPSLESHANTVSGRYLKLGLPKRVLERPMPAVEIVDLARSEPVGDGVFTRPLATALEATLAAGEQAVLFLNRRGFAPYIYCRDCGHAFRCADCDVTLTLHQRRAVLLCHYCGFVEPAPDVCPKCLGHKLAGFGLGTERIESELHALFGDVRTLRLDRDVTRTRRQLETTLARFQAREAQVLIGTQMVAKGHDFPSVTLVGVIAADASLNFPDFRAAERTFQLLAQVSGRAGRGDSPGRVILQAYETEHYAVQAASHHDYEEFVSREMGHRRELGYPPFSHLALLRFESADEARALRAAETAAVRLRSRVDAEHLAAKILGPAPAPLSRLRGVWRIQVLIKALQRTALRPLFAALGDPRDAEVRQILDVDPLSML
ncbi:MAG: primosomal protein N' [Deltaproteobacteria bacterium]|nr:primosomal protein N' [Deltaproteobacteria bacterium]